MLHYYEVSNSGPLYSKRPKLTTTLTLPYRKKLVLFNLYRCQFVKINTLPIAVQKYNIKNLKLHIAYCKRALELFIKKKKKKKKQNRYKYCLKISYTYHSFIYLKKLSYCVLIITF